MNQFCVSLLFVLNAPSLPARAIPTAWQESLDILAARVANSLADPVPFRFEMRDEPRRKRFSRDLLLASVWPRPEFRDSLVRIAEGDERWYIPFAARGLLNYRDPELDLIVERLRKDKRETGAPCDVMSLGSAVGMFTDAFDANATIPRGPFETTWREPEGLTVDRIVPILLSNDPGARFRAARWLLNNGIVFDARPIVDAWPTLPEGARSGVIRVLEYRNLRVGDESARSLLEFILCESWRELSARDQGFLLRALARRGTPFAHSIAQQVIDSATRGVGGSQKDTLLLSDAFWTLARVATHDDVEPALKWLERDDTVFKQGALCVLAHIDDPRAIDVVSEVIAAGLPGRYKDGIWPEVGTLEALRERDWPDLEYKWHYIRALDRSLAETCIKGKPTDWAGELLLADLIETLNVLTGVNNGWTGRVFPAGFNFKAASETAGRWSAWIVENDPFASDERSEVKGQSN